VTVNAKGSWKFEGLLDIIFDLTPEKIDETVVYINESLDPMLPELQPEFDKMKLRVETALNKSGFLSG
jgi:hypothetical protein